MSHTATSASNPAAAGTTAGAAMETPSESRGGGGTPGIQPCAWETTETKFIQMLKDLSRKCEEIAPKVDKGIQDARNTLERWQQSWVGKQLRPALVFIDQVLQAIQIAVKVITQAIKFIAWVIPKLMAPWTIRSIGRQMQDPFVGKMNDFSESLAVANLESQKSWRSKSGEEFLARAQEQYEQGGKPTVEATKRFAEKTTELGDRAVAATEALVSDLTGGITDIISAVKDLKAVTKLLPKLFKSINAAIKIITLIYNIIKFAWEVCDSANDFASAVQTVTERPWPNAISN